MKRGWFWRALFSMLFVTSGTLHLVNPEPFLRIMPPQLTWPGALVAISGIAEIAGGIGLWIPALSRAAAWGLVVLLIAVFPANIYMAVSHVAFPGVLGEPWVQWLRLPLQIPLIWWAWHYTRVAPPAGALSRRPA